jgi:hypothetical protein
VSRADHDGIDEFEKLRTRVREGVYRLRGLDTGDELGVEILAQLVDGRKSAAEIVLLVYGLRKGDEGFKSCYTRVARGIRKLESKGLVSRKLMGRDKPYRLTQLAIANLARIGGEEQQLPVLPWYDAAVYLATLGLTAAVGVQSLGWIQLPETPTIGLSALLCMLLGASICELVRTLRRVF